MRREGTVLPGKVGGATPRGANLALRHEIMRGDSLSFGDYVLGGTAHLLRRNRSLTLRNDY